MQRSPVCLLAAVSSGTLAGCSGRRRLAGTPRQAPNMQGADSLQRIRKASSSSTSLTLSTVDASGPIFMRPSSSGSQKALTLNSAVRCISAKAPKDMSGRLSRYDCGEDAFFLAAPTAGAATVGLADGVGGWANQGIDPAQFPWELMDNCRAAAEGGAINPQKVLELAYENVLGSDDIPAGSCTACITSLDRRTGEIQIANLGDSSAMLIRAEGETILQSDTQQHRFNCPYQLGFDPVFGRPLGDNPCDASLYRVQAQASDLLVLATDGFFDNVWPWQLHSAIASLRHSEPRQIAEALATMAHARSAALEESPFAVDARRHGISHSGGKLDDITVIVARIEHSAP